MRNHLCICVALLWLVPFELLGQDDFKTVYGKVYNAQTQEPIPFANIQLKSRSIGTATNANGDFVFKIPRRWTADTLLISSVGYRTATLAIPSGEIIAVGLDPATVVLQEVTVKAKSGLSIFKEILSKIPENYDTTAVRMTAFHTESYWLGDFELAFNEAVLEVVKVFKYDKKRNDQIRIIKGRKKHVDFGRDGQFLFWISNVSNTARSILREDLVKYSNVKLTPFNPRNFRFFNYEHTETLLEHGQNLMIIDISPKQKSRRGYVRSKVYVDEASLAIVKIDIEVTTDGIKYINKHQKGGLAYAIMSKVVGASLDFSAIRVGLSYKKYRDKWYLNSIQRHWEAKVNSKKRNMVDRVWSADMNFLVTDIQPDSVVDFTEGDISNSSISIGSMIGNDYDPSFWANFNFLKPIRQDSLRQPQITVDSSSFVPQVKVSNRDNGFTRADTLRGKLTEVRSCYDVSFYDLDVTVDMNQRLVRGSNRIFFTAVSPFQTMQIDLYENMTIDRIMYGSRSLPFKREHNAVFVEFSKRFSPGERGEIIIYYGGIPKVPDHSIPMDGGVLWSTDSLGNPWVQMVCQGSGASLWWPNKDHLSDEPDSMKIAITVPNEFTEISNGRLVRKMDVPGNMTRYEWFVSYPINNYNATFNIGKYAHFRDQFISQDSLTIDYYVMPYHINSAKNLFQQVKPMLACFEKYFGPYPFSRDGFTLVESLHAMEHQSGVCIGKIPEQNAGNPNPLLWHESAHEWWGNALSCKDMADLWLHEAFATYGESLFVEYEHGKDAALQYINDHSHAVKNEQPIVGVYDVNHIFYDIGDMYEKGMLMLNTFRHVLDSDSTWFHLLKDIQDHFRYQTLTTDELVKFINGQTKTDYTYFFEQYLKHTSLPELEIVLQETVNGLQLTYRWNADVDNFRMPVKVTFGVDRFDFIYPTPERKIITFKGMNMAEFEVDEKRFFIDVNESGE